ncbi:SEC-C metal-binding domain-containing protein [Lysobacter sp. Hz 25]
MGRNDPCPCGSTRRFKELLPARRPLRRLRTRSLLQGLTTAVHRCR